ncbi:hypothetical protein BIU96_14005 [Curtobacterium sp. MCBA15_008]|nr:hypothetical protein BIU96_14005 [Curtobacterium sp. MCBA15_008]
MSGDHGMPERCDIVADEEANEKPATRSEHTDELIERTMDRVGLVMDQRVPRQDPVVAILRILEGVDIADRERRIGIGLSCVLDELRNLVNTSYLMASLPEERGPVAGAATSV